MDIQPFSGSGGIAFVVGAMGLLQVAWYGGVIVLLIKIWNKVKHLP
jgi:hypothetical protein